MNSPEPCSCRSCDDARVLAAAVKYRVGWYAARKQVALEDAVRKARTADLASRDPATRERARAWR